jgi:hypothetical protein
MHTTSCERHFTVRDVQQVHVVKEESCLCQVTQPYSNIFILTIIGKGFLVLKHHATKTHENVEVKLHTFLPRHYTDPSGQLHTKPLGLKRVALRSLNPLFNVTLN